MKTESGSTFRYIRIGEEIRERIKSGRYPDGARIPTEQDFAAEFAVNRHTIRRALELLVQEGVLSRTAGRGTFVSSAAEKEGPLLYVGPYEGHYFRDLYCALSREAQAAGQTLLAFNPDLAPDPDSAGTGLREHLRMASAVIVGGSLYQRDTVDFTGFAAPVILLENDMLTSAGIHNRVVTDLYSAARLVMGHLIARGHRRIAFCSSVACEDGRTGPGGFPLPERANRLFAAYTDERRHAGLEWECAFAFLSAAEEVEVDERILTFLKYLTTEKATALVCFSDYRAIQVVRAARHLGLSLPGALCITGVGNTPWAEACHPALTSVSLEEKTAAHLAVHLCRNATLAPGTGLAVAPRLVERASVCDGPSLAGPKL